MVKKINKKNYSDQIVIECTTNKFQNLNSKKNLNIYLIVEFKQEIDVTQSI